VLLRFLDALDTYSSDVSLFLNGTIPNKRKSKPKNQRNTKVISIFVNASICQAVPQVTDVMETAEFPTGVPAVI